MRSRVFDRLVFAVAGALTGAELAALYEARAMRVVAGGAHGPSFVALAAADVAVLVPVAVAAGILVALLDIVMSPAGPLWPGEIAAHLRGPSVLIRSRRAAAATLAIFVALAWCIGSAHLARVALAQHGAPGAIGGGLAVASMALFLALSAGALALLPTVRRLLATAASTSLRVVDPLVTGGAAIALSFAVLAWGVARGDTGGDGGALEIFGVLKRHELDLRPVFALAVIAAVAHAAALLLSRVRSLPRAVRLGVSLLVIVAPAAATIAEARGLEKTPAVARAIERGAPLGKIGLAALRRATDRDKDGASALFAGGDCDDHDPHRSPTAVDEPGNGIDEDCSGADLPLAPAVRSVPETEVPPEKAADFPDDLNVFLLTIDTLRTDVGFMGYPKEVTPNLDALAARSTVFDRAYAMASYTGKSIAPMLIGRYPNETMRDGGHFNTYAPSNVFLAERLHAAGIRTMGAASHWYFNTWSGLSQGMDVWDLSAKPPSGQGDSDTSVTGRELADATLRILGKEENVGRRFFLWVHFFDPHAQYMPHEGAPDFGGGTGWAAQAKAAYDAEVWFTDKHIGRVLRWFETSPQGRRTAIIVTADHGEAFSEHGMSNHGVELWESLVRVPLFIYVPGLPGRRVAVKRSQIDLVPTVLELMGVPLPPVGELRGRSWMPDVALVPGAEHVERDVYLDMPAGPYNALRRGLIHGPTPGMKLIHLGGRQMQLFDLVRDPGELDDLSGDASLLDPVKSAYDALRGHLEEIEVRPQSSDLK